MSTIVKRNIRNPIKEERVFSTPGMSGELHARLEVSCVGLNYGLTKLTVVNGDRSGSPELCSLFVQAGSSKLKALNPETLRQLEEMLELAAAEVERIGQHVRSYEGTDGSEDVV